MTNQLEETEPMSITPKPPQIIPYLIYRDVGAALDFLCHALGFKEEQRHGTPSGGMHGEASFQGQLVMLGQGGREHSLKTPKDVGAATTGVFIYLDDVDKHYDVAKAAGAEIVHPPKDVVYGRTYWANDPERHPWFFTSPPKAQ
jgi:PhnB protein